MNVEEIKSEEDINSIDDSFLNSNNIENGFKNELLNYAFHYAKAGYPVISLHNVIEENGLLQCSCTKGLDCPFPGKHPRTRNGLKDATTDVNIIIDLWGKYPDGNIGLLAGKNAGFFVLDIDIKTDVENPYKGEDSLEAMQEDYKLLLGENYSPLPETLTAYSGSGGRHLYFKHNLDLIIKNSRSKIGSGLDIKSDNGYIIAPPSNHKSGNKYQRFGVNTPIEDAPDWLIYEIQIAMKLEESQSTSNTGSKTKSYNGEKIPVGQRNDYLFPQICGLINSYSKEEVIRRALKINEERFAEPMKNEEILKIIDWSWNKYRKGKKENRGLKK